MRHGREERLRDLGSFALREVAPGEADQAFFSSDDASLGFFKETELWRLDLAESEPVRVGAIPEIQWDISSAAWHTDGRMLITRARGLWSIPASGGAPQLILAGDAAAREYFNSVQPYRWPATGHLTGHHDMTRLVR